MHILTECAITFAQRSTQNFLHKGIMRAKENLRFLLRFLLNSNKEIVPGTEIEFKRRAYILCYFCMSNVYMFLS